MSNVVVDDELNPVIEGAGNAVAPDTWFDPPPVPPALIARNSTAYDVLSTRPEIVIGDDVPDAATHEPESNRYSYPVIVAEPDGAENTTDNFEPSPDTGDTDTTDGAPGNVVPDTDDDGEPDPFTFTARTTTE